MRLKCPREVAIAVCCFTLKISKKVSSAGQNGVLLRNRGLIEVTGVDGRLLVNGLATADVLTAPLSTQYCF